MNLDYFQSPSRLASLSCRASLRLLLVLGLGLFTTDPAWAQVVTTAGEVPSPTTYLVVRHAEREGEEDALSEAGRRRAEQLRSLGELLHVSAIYSTDYRRTKETVAPLVEALGIQLQLYKEVTPQWLAELRAANRGGVVLIVGHSNTVGMIASELGAASVAEIPPTEYDNLFIISEQASTRSLVRVRFGSSQPGRALSVEKMGPLQGTPAEPKKGG